MKYWIFDGSDVVGPFTPQELAARPGFASTSLICPENFSEDEDSWNPASKFPDFHFDAQDGSAEVVIQESEDENFEKEMDTLLHEHSPLEVSADSIQDTPSLEIPKKPSKPGPIEEYFNTINGEDLGDILGIPDPNETSDMNLARALETQFNKTNPPTDKEISPLEEDPFDEFTEEEEETEEETAKAMPLSAEKGAAEPQPVEEKTNPEKSPAAQEEASSPQEEPVVLPQTTVREEGPASVPISQTDENEDFLSLTVSSKEDEKETAKTEEKNKKNIPQAKSTPVYEPEGEEDESIQPCELPTLAEQENPFLEKKEQELPKEEEEEEEENPVFSAPLSEEEESEKAEKEDSVSTSTAWVDVTSQKEETDETKKEKELQNKEEQTDEASSRHEALPQNAAFENTLRPEINQIRSRLKKTTEIEKFLTTQQVKIKQSNHKMKTVFMFLLALLAVGVGLYINSLFPPTAAPIEKAETPVIAEKPVANPQKTLPVPPPPQPTVQDKVLAVVQNYQLPNEQGTIASYFDRTYKDKLDKGYTASWSAETLHKSTYIVKYRLTKTRMEPIVYVFQVDAARERLTGALNNIALDLVGKI